jgi:hypothetical protein
MKGCFFLLGVAAVDDVGRPSAAYAGNFGREGGWGAELGRRCFDIALLVQDRRTYGPEVIKDLRNNVEV